MTDKPPGQLLYEASSRRAPWAKLTRWTQALWEIRALKKDMSAVQRATRKAKP